MPKRYAVTNTEGYVTGLISDDVHSAEQIPVDAHPISEDSYQSLRDAQSAGKVGRRGEDGEWLLVERPGPTAEELVSRAQAHREMLLEEATRHIAPLQDAVDVSMATPEEVTALQQWKRYRVLLARVDANAPTWPTPPQR